MSLVLIVLVAALAADAPSVGVEGRIEVVLAESDLAARPTLAKAALALRVAGRSEVAGGTRYDLRWLGVEPGEYDLAHHLVDRRGLPVSGLPAIPVQVRALLPDAHDGSLTATEVALPRLGGYRRTATIVLAAWAVCGVALIVRRRRRTAVAVITPEPTPGERLATLVGLAAEGRLDADGRATLERLLVATWRTRLGLDGLAADAAVARLRADPAAGELLARLDAWLHAPPGRHAVDLPALLADCQAGAA